jgi:hypothetical protein
MEKHIGTVSFEEDDINNRAIILNDLDPEPKIVILNDCKIGRVRPVVNDESFKDLDFDTLIINSDHYNIYLGGKNPIKEVVLNGQHYKTIKTNGVIEYVPLSNYKTIQDTYFIIGDIEQSADAKKLCLQEAKIEGTQLIGERVFAFDKDGYCIPGNTREEAENNWNIVKNIDSNPRISWLNLRYNAIVYMIKPLDKISSIVNKIRSKADLAAKRVSRKSYSAKQKILDRQRWSIKNR